jgi:hypothetical protein
VSEVEPVPADPADLDDLDDLANLADRLAAAVSACPDVVRLSRVTPGVHIDGVSGDVEVATYLPGRRVAGVRVRPDGVTVRVVCRYGPTVDELAAQVRAAVVSVWPTCPRIDVIIDDLEVPPVPAVPIGAGG